MFFKHETESNLVLKALKEEYSDILRTFFTHDDAFIVIPQNITIDQLVISRSFVESHIIFPNPSNPLQCITSNGIHLVFSKSKDNFTVINLPHESTNQKICSYNPLIDLNTFFLIEKKIYENLNEENPKNQKIHVLREGVVQIKEKLKINVILISDPINPERGQWEKKKEKEEKAVELNVDTLITPSQTQLSQKQIQMKVLLESPSNTGNMEPLFPDLSEDNLGENNNTSSNSGEQNESFFSKNTLMKYPKRIISKFFNQSNNMQDTLPENIETTPTNNPESTFNIIEKMKHPTASPIANSIRNFISEFGNNKNIKSVHIPSYVGKFLHETQNLISNNPLWNGASNEQMDETFEYLERIVISKIYKYVFSPDPNILQRDKEFYQLLEELQFLEPKHLDLTIDISQQKLFDRAVEELRNVNQFKVPRDKMVCILNCSKIIFKILSAKGNNVASADEFLPMLILVVLRANPKNLYSNLCFIENYRDENKMVEESAYYFTQIVSCVSFLKNLNPDSLTIDKNEFYEKLQQRKLNIKSSSNQNLNTTHKSTSTTTETSKDNNTNNKNNDIDTVVPRIIEKFLTFEGRDPFEFEHTRIDDLRMKDIPFLFQHYKSLINVIRNIQIEMEKK